MPSDRYFRNKAIDKASSSGKSSSTEKRQEELFENGKACTALARRYFQICLDFYEDNSTNKRRSSSKSSSLSSQLGSLYKGALGPRVYLRLLMAQHLQKQQQSPSLDDQKEIASLLQTALTLAQQVVQETETQKPQQRVTLLTGPYVGAKALLAALHQALGDAASAQQHANELIGFLQTHTATMHSRECEVLYGRAGAIQAILFLRQQLHDTQLGSSVVVALAQAIVQEGIQTAAKHNQLPLLWEWHESHYLGAAHGVVGILHTLLCLTPSERQQLPHATNNNLIPQTIHALNSLCWPESGNLRSSIGSTHDKLVHWCHGAPGHVLLLAKAHQVFGGTNYLEQAQTLANTVIWPRGLLRKGVGLCHGISGNAYCFLAVLQHASRTAEADDWRRRACYFAAFGIEHWDELHHVPDQPYSVHVGAGGLALLLMDLGTLASSSSNHNTEATRFPLYDF
ncbi:LanC-like protein 2 [Seminavis robusta]|uniref:LanC-like protein 2 n=1 Tax=Seminavis robusta TaxID=568900 RepID=A0A9N8DCA7_9STRA|nr:LanC-like protein 2 [Seminavis robusta]|eukprot:Sro86_g045720.1 LanC-like protein 2 (455) ;mRNA; f:50304-51668